MAKDDPHQRLVDDVRRLAGYAEAIVAHAERLDEDVPEQLADCVAAWWRWHRALADPPGDLNKSDELD